MYEQETLEYDVLIVGAGPAGLAAAIRLQQCAQEAGKAISVCVLEKGAAVGSHILSGAVIDPVGLDALLPDWRKQSGFSWGAVKEERHIWLYPDSASPLPTSLMPAALRNRGAIMASLGDVCHYLGQQAESLGVDICTGFAATKPIIENGVLLGVMTGDAGLDKQGARKVSFTPGVAIRARYTLMAEGARGSLAAQVEAQFQLRNGCAPQKYALGLKELWRVTEAQHQSGLLIHATGWPLSADEQGGVFLYHLPQGLVSLGLVAHLDYKNPYFSPFEAFQQAKTHPAISEFLHGGERLGFGARALSCGGAQSVPELVFSGGVLIGCAAGLLNPARAKGVHSAMISGILAAEAAYSALSAGRSGDVLLDYPQALEDSTLWAELDASRNFKPWLSRYGKAVGGFIAGAELWAGQCGVRMPWTLSHQSEDHSALLAARDAQAIVYPVADGELSFDRASSLHLSGVAHEEDQPCHLHIKASDTELKASLARYVAAETRYCPAGVYEVTQSEGGARLLIHAADCLHCKTCEIKDPSQHIIWQPPEGGGGPNYRGM